MNENNAIKNDKQCIEEIEEEKDLHVIDNFDLITEIINKQKPFIKYEGYEEMYSKKQVIEIINEVFKVLEKEGY